jgi:hypothetical protein
MVHKVRASAKRKVSHLANNVVTMVIVDGAALRELSHVKLPDDTRVAIIPGKSDSFQDIRSAIGTIKTEVEEFAVQRRSRSARFGVKRFGKARTINQAAFAPDVRGRAILEGVRVAQQDLEDAGGAYDLEQVRTLLRGISRQAIDKRVQEGSLLAVPGPSNHRSYPTLQFNRDGSIVAGLRDVREALPVESPWAVLNFLVNPDDRLEGRKPIDVLRSGNVGEVIEAARLYGEAGG